MWLLSAFHYLQVFVLIYIYIHTHTHTHTHIYILNKNHSAPMSVVFFRRKSRFHEKVPRRLYFTGTFILTDRQVGRLVLMYEGYLYSTDEATSVRKAGIWYFSVICYPISFSLKGYMFEFDC